MTSNLESIKYSRGAFQILNQLKVPHELSYRDILSVEDAIDSIKTMQVRGAPLIAIVGCLGIAVELNNKSDKTWANCEELLEFLKHELDMLIHARPTAVNMRKEAEALLKFCKEEMVDRDLGVGALKLKVIEYIENMVTVDLNTNKLIGRNGAKVIKKEGALVNVLTHCNTGSLATSGFGTALGVIRALYQSNSLDTAYFTETRPYNQGSRLTSFELLHENIPHTLICDSAVSWLMKTNHISAIVVGADRVALNGDTANKIGTYQIALVAKAHNVPFYIAAPFSTIDPTILSGDFIKIEERSSEEVTHIMGKPISPEGIRVWNPAFDVTPAELIAGIITEKGVFTPADLTKHLQTVMS